MNVRVHLFARARQLAGCDLLEVELPSGGTIGQLRSEIERRWPQLADFLPFCLFAVDAGYANDTTAISPQATVACIPPVSGG